MVSTRAEALETAIWSALDEVTDPEIPAVSVVDMGMIREVRVDGGHAHVVVLPTFTGCPAVDVIKADVGAAVDAVEGVAGVTVETSFDPPWTTDRITARGRQRLREFGLAPPQGPGGAGGPVLVTEIGLPQAARCPYCGSTDTVNDSPFGPTPCRAIYYCRACRNPFEQFKPV